ncbi:PH domain-containing protein [Sphingomonas sp. PAMC 26605]|uniref:PH domain-containing protein n=1 Tax=Sphingomonas sp. PAMC 26605 TaxID=1112214 RepID=UPI00026CD7E1|nr:PH domain-containing protein [Sphingomonas sp. PAMC 26605]
MFDLAQTPIVLIGPKGMPLMMIAAGLMAMVVGIVVWSVTHIALIGGIVELVGLWVLAVGIAIRKMGFRLTIAPEGLSYVNLGGKRFWRWRDVDSFALDQFKTAWVISFREYTKDPRGKHFYLPSRWDRPKHEVVDLLIAAQAKWGTSS